MIKDEKLRQSIEAVRNARKTFKLFNGEEIEIARLTTNDCAELEKSQKMNLFGILADMARTGTASLLSYELQRFLFFQALKKTMPEITLEEAGDIITALAPGELARALVWILIGTEATPA